ncbi:MAG TPA: hypothetical protein DCS55_07300 [Acidimicrobiaceae bacterium]|nr:hypothetical protein [Acidimicrobiaceae bacterium]
MATRMAAMTAPATTRERRPGPAVSRSRSASSSAKVSSHAAWCSRPRARIEGWSWAMRRMATKSERSAS